MAAAEPFTFGVPLVAQAAAGNWSLVEALLDLTLTSLRGQTDQDFRVVIAGHDRPRIPFDNARTTFITAHWPTEPIRADNLDSGRKKYAVNQLVLERGGGLLMFLDADDWVDMRLVETARAVIGPNHIGGLIDRGFATDFRGLRAASIPHPRIFKSGFHRICGSSTIARLRPDDSDPLWRDPYRVLHEHYRWIEVAREHNAAVVRLPVCGNYVLNTSENHSEVHGPYADWRRSFAAAVRREGNAVTDAFLARFGLQRERVRAASARFFPPIAPHPPPRSDAAAKECAAAASKGR
jgi:hypothetical protein